MGTTKFDLSPMDTVRQLLQVDGVTYAAGSGGRLEQPVELLLRVPPGVLRGGDADQANMDNYYIAISNARRSGGQGVR